jgi:hypothetical protein
MTMPDAEKLEGAISGRALYDGRIDPAEALGMTLKAGHAPLLRWQRAKREDAQTEEEA